MYCYISINLVTQLFCVNPASRLHYFLHECIDCASLSFAASGFILRFNLGFSVHFTMPYSSSLHALLFNSSCFTLHIFIFHSSPLHASLFTSLCFTLHLFVLHSSPLYASLFTSSDFSMHEAAIDPAPHRLLTTTPLLGARLGLHNDVVCCVFLLF